MADGTLLLIVGVLIIVAAFAWTVVQPASPGGLLLVLGLLVVAWGAFARYRAKKVAEMDATTHHSDSRPPR